MMAKNFTALNKEKATEKFVAFIYLIMLRANKKHVHI